MPKEVLQWDLATLELKPDVSPKAMKLAIPTRLEPFTALILVDLIEKDIVAEISLDKGEVLDVHLGLEGDSTSAFEEATEVAITADRLMDRFDPADLRARLDALVAKAAAEGEIQTNRAQSFIDVLTASPAS